jgi:glycosyl hydrolase family 76
MILDSHHRGQPQACLGALGLSVRPRGSALSRRALALLCALAAPAVGVARAGALAPASASAASPSPALAVSRATPSGGGGPARAARARARPPGGRKRPRKQALRGNPLRAQLAFEAMQRYDYIAGSGLYTGEPFSSLWAFSQALADTVSLSEIPGKAATFAHELHVRLVGLASYLDTSNSGEPEGTFTSSLAAFDGVVAPPAGPGGAKFYDDNDWVAIELARVYELTHKAAALGSAEGIMAFEMAGWQTDPTFACPGGIPFSNQAENSTRNTVTDAPGAELALQLYRITRNAQYLQFAQTAYEWVRRCLLLPSGLYADNIRRHGAVDPTVWSYNQGSMIGAGTLLYQITGNGEYLYEARQTARAALAYFNPERLAAEIPFFPSVYFRNLLYLDSVTHDPSGRRLAQTYVDSAWQHLRLSSGLFVWGSPPSTELLVQAAMVQIYALLSSPASTYF